MPLRPPDKVDVALGAVERLMHIYRFERFIFLMGAAAGMVLLIYAAWLTINGGRYDKESLGYFFGAGGAFATSGAYVLYQLRQTFALVRAILFHEVGIKP